MYALRRRDIRLLRQRRHRARTRRHRRIDRRLEIRLVRHAERDIAVVVVTVIVVDISIRDGLAIDCRDDPVMAIRQHPIRTIRRRHRLTVNQLSIDRV